ncbi:Zn-ribbon domain-containing OB-fold protein [Pseudonocardia kunmingensis]|uniref:OB-fold protein n=1 Tax=Pseudonocardia kunmingensis TaxID=630975 RepID=A0A543DPL9_9PSEU|nr:OB-fold domain-containing protein [Pseudonocardia kunmingensis]TQM11243.1 hypothetical protein FB558_3798 [Pseudonocardia kunmingensis]
MSGRSVPVLTPETSVYWEKAAQRELWLPRCGACERTFFPPRAHCPHCAAEDVRWYRASGTGTLASYVISHRPAPGYGDDVPYVIALVDLPEGPRLTTNLLGVEARPEALRVGLPLEVGFEQRGDVVLPQFRVVTGAGR